ncbi:MAG: CorA family divalent cation transporter [Candidatus Micrarchaeota archaeon]
MENTNNQNIYCVSLSKNGKTTSLAATETNGIPDMVKTNFISWVDIVTDEIEKTANKISPELGFSKDFLLKVFSNDKPRYEDFDSELAIIIPSITVSGFIVKLNSLYILVKENLVLTIHSKEVQRFVRLRRYGKVMLGKLNPKHKAEDNLSLLFIRLIDENNDRNFDYLKEIQEHSDSISSKLADPKFSRTQISKEIHKMKHALISYLSGLWITVDVLNSFKYGDAKLFTDDEVILGKFGNVVDSVSHQISLAEHLSAVLSSGFEVLQSIYNNQLQILNNRIALLMAYLTIVGTAVLVPNTLATALSGTIFNLGPKDANWYIILLVASTIISTVLAYVIVKRAGLLPERPE